MTTEQARSAAPPVERLRRRDGARLVQILGSPRAPLALLVVGVAAIAAWAVSFSVRITSWALDETVMRSSAMHYLHGLPGNLFHDPSARATSRLYPLLISRFFAGSDGDVAIRLAHALSALLFCSTAIPTYLLARRVLRSGWAASLAALLSIGAPWLALSSALFTENLAFPLFMWALWAMVRAVERPSLRSDLVVLILIGLCTVTRVQLLVLLPAWVLTAWLLTWLTRPSGLARGDAVKALGRGVARITPLSHAAVGFGLLIIAWRFHRGTLHHDVARVTGTYSELQDRGHVSSDIFPAMVVELVAFSLPVITAAAAALGWFGATLRGPRVGHRWRFAVTATCVLAALWLFTAYVQGGFLGPITEERYYVYAFPLLWIGAFLALEEPATALRALVPAAIVLLLLAAIVQLPTTPLTAETAFLAPSNASIAHALGRIVGWTHIAGLTVRDATTVICLILLVPAVYVWRRFARLRVAAFVVVPAALQIAVASYAFAARSGHVPGVGGVTGGDFHKLAWVDRALHGDQRAIWLNNQVRSPELGADGIQIGTEFWNPKIDAYALEPTLNLPGVVPNVAPLMLYNVVIDQRSGAVGGLPGTGPFFVQERDSPFLQLAGRRVAASKPDDLELADAGPKPHLRWLGRGLASDGVIDPKRPVRFWAYDPVAAARPLRVVLTVKGPETGPGEFELRFGKQVQSVQLGPQASTTETFTICPRPGHAVGGARGVTAATLADGRPSAGRILSVVLQQQGGRC